MAMALDLKRTGAGECGQSLLGPETHHQLALAAGSEALPDPFIADSEGVSVDDDGQPPVKGQQNTEGERGNKAAGR
jgi:hypothetical protein